MGFGGDNIFGLPLTLGQFGFMAEAEGQADLVDTREARVNAVCNTLDEISREDPDADLIEYIDDILEHYGIDPYEVEPHERKKIDKHLGI